MLCRRISIHPFAHKPGPLLPASLNVHGEAKQSTFKIDVPIATLKYNIMHEYETLQRMQKVQVFQLGTYQGKYSGSGRDSTNGCAVISPLVAIHHLSNVGAASLPAPPLARLQLRQRLWRRLLPLYSRHDRCADSGRGPGRSWRPREWLLL